MNRFFFGRFFDCDFLMGDYRRYDFNRLDLIAGLTVFLMTLSFYTYYLTPSVAAGDNGELTSAMFYLGLGHAPGYPIHSLFGKLMTFLPGESVAWKANFFSAFCGAVTIFLSFLVYLKLLMSLGIKKVFAVFSSWVGAMTFMTSNALWAQSITTEVYTISAIFHPLLLLVLLKWKDEIISLRYSPRLYLGERYLLAYGFLLGVAVGGHQTVVLVEFFTLFGLVFFVYHYQIKNREQLGKKPANGIFYFVLVMLLVIIGWSLYYKYIVAYKSNLFINNNHNTIMGVWGFVIPHLILIGFYVGVRFFMPRELDPNNFFQRLSLFVVKFLGMFFLGFCVYLYLFIRSHANPPINWGGISESSYYWDKIAKFFTMINRKQFQPNTMVANLFTIYMQFKLILLKVHWNQFAHPIFLIIFLGAVYLFRRCKFYLLFLGVGFVTYVVQLTLYLNADFRDRDLFFIEFFYIFSYFILSCWVPFGMVFILEKVEALAERLALLGSRKSKSRKLIRETIGTGHHDRLSEGD